MSTLNDEVGGCGVFIVSYIANITNSEAENELMQIEPSCIKEFSIETIQQVLKKYERRLEKVNPKLRTQHVGTRLNPFWRVPDKIFVLVGLLQESFQSVCVRIFFFFL